MLTQYVKQIKPNHYNLFIVHLASRDDTADLFLGYIRNWRPNVRLRDEGPGLVMGARKAEAVSLLFLAIILWASTLKTQICLDFMADTWSKIFSKVLASDFMVLNRHGRFPVFILKPRWKGQKWLSLRQSPKLKRNNIFLHRFLPFVEALYSHPKGISQYL